MEIIKKFFPEVLKDNEENYFLYLQGVIEAVDELSSMQITMVGNDYHFRISPSLPRYSDMLIEHIINMHKLFNIHLDDFSKSVKTSGSINYKIKLN